MALFHSIAFSFPGEIDPTTITKDHVRFAVWLRLPYRLRVGMLRHFAVDGSTPTDIWVHNRFDVPADTDIREVVRRSGAAGYGHSWVHLWSEVLVIIKSPRVSPELLEVLQTGLGNIPFQGQASRALAVFNHFICAYATATGELFGGAPLKALTDIEMFNSLHAEVAIVCKPDYAINAENIREILQWTPDRTVLVSGQIAGDLGDLSDEMIRSIVPTLPKVIDHPFHEIAFKAKTEMVSRDPIVALVLACAALEGAHAAFLRGHLDGPLVKHDKLGLIENLLREQGIHTLIQVSALVFLPEAQRPEKALLDRCVRGIEMRNGIMHIKSSKKGYAIRSYTLDEMNDAYGGVMEMYNIFVKSVPD